MSLLTSLYSGASGMEANSLDLSVIGDNISNANTIGFKQSRAAFEDQFAQSLVGGNQVGLGTRLQSVQKILSQGALTTTGQATDLAIQGNGFFIAKGSHDGLNGSYYTRAGQFTVDKSGYLVNLDGLRIQGYPADSTGALTGVLGDLDIGAATAPPKATTQLTIRANLQSDATIPAAWDATNPTGTSNFSTSTTVYDSLGAAHQVTTYFRRNDIGSWEWHAMTDGGGLQGGIAGQQTEIATGTLTFDSSGKLDTVTQTTNFNPVGAVQPQALNFNFGDPLSAGGTGLAGTTQFASPSATTFLDQDGYASGDLANISVDSKGQIRAPSPMARAGSSARWPSPTSRRPTSCSGSAATSSPPCPAQARRWWAERARAAAVRSRRARWSSRTSTSPVSS